jgi:hypothetical protein
MKKIPKNKLVQLNPLELRYILAHKLQVPATVVGTFCSSDDLLDCLIARQEGLLTGGFEGEWLKTLAPDVPEFLTHCVNYALGLITKIPDRATMSEVEVVLTKKGETARAANPETTEEEETTMSDPFPTPPTVAARFRPREDTKPEAAPATTATDETAEVLQTALKDLAGEMLTISQKLEAIDSILAKDRLDGIKQVLLFMFNYQIAKEDAPFESFDDLVQGINSI